MNKKTGIIILVLLALVAGFYILRQNDGPVKFETAVPQINPSDFSTNITNKYLTLPVGKQITYEANTPEGVEKIEILITDKTRNIMGVETVVYWDRVWVGGVLKEDTRDYIAQDKEGNVWYFGEDVDNYEGGKLDNHDGSWIAGVDGAKPGILIKAFPEVGESYKQEQYPGKAEDTVEVLSMTESLEVRGKKYTDCLKTYDTNPLDEDSKEHKYYCPEAGGLVLVKDLTKNESVELVEVKLGVQTPSDFSY